MRVVHWSCKGYSLNFTMGLWFRFANCLRKIYTLDNEYVNPVKEFSPEIQHLLSSYAKVFADKLTFPPPRGC
jgi:hypothetical protein